MPSNYPTSIPSPTVKTNGVDIIDADHINNSQDDIVAIANFIGASGAVQSHSAILLALLQGNYVGWRVYKKDVDEIYVGAGAGVIANAGETIRELKRTTSVTTLSASDIDTGTLAANTFYYIYVCGGNAATTPTIVFSASSASPTGYTVYKKIGWFYNETVSVLNITLAQLGNIKDGSDNPNAVQALGTDDITVTSDSYVDMAGMEINFVSNGRPVKITYNAPHHFSAGAAAVWITIDVDGTDKVETIIAPGDPNEVDLGLLSYIEALSVGEHTIKVQWKRHTAGGTIYQDGASEGDRVLIVEEK